MSGPDEFKHASLEKTEALPSTENVERSDSGDNLKTPEKILREPAHIQAEIAEVDEKITSERALLKESWGKFAMEPPESTNAIDSLQERRQALLNELPTEFRETEGNPNNRAEVETPENKQGRKNNETLENPSPPEIERDPKGITETSGTLRDSMSKAGERLRATANIFIRRDERNLYPLLSREDATKISAAAASLEGISPTTPAEYEQVGAAIRSMTQAFENYGRYRASIIKEDGESLRDLAIASRQTQDEVRTMQTMLAQGTSQGATEASRAAGRLADIVENIQNRASRAAERLTGYGVRR